MYTKQEIVLQYYRESKSQRYISRTLGISRDTVKKYISSYELYISKHGDKESNLRDYLNLEPQYNSSNRTKSKLTPSLKSKIDSYLKLNDNRRLEGLTKQVLNNKSIWELLVKQGFDIGYCSVSNYIKDKTKKEVSKEVFIRQCYKPGEICEFDWGEVKLLINGESKKLNMAVFTSSYSNLRYALLFERQDTLAFMESHVKFFDYTQGVFKEMIYDNMRVAVAKFVGKHEKEPTKALLDMRAHYHFSHRFCNAYKGNEKGHVERSVEVIRKKTFSVLTEFSTIEEAQTYLLKTLEELNSEKQQLTGKSANELFEEEKNHLYEAQPQMHCNIQAQSRVDKYCTISYKKNRYSVPDNLVGKILDLNVSSHIINIYYNNSLVATHSRNYGLHQWIINIEHYLKTLKRKPGALSGSVALDNNKYLKNLYQEFFIGHSREFIDLLYYCKNKSITQDKLSSCIQKLKRISINDISSEKIIALLGNETEDYQYDSSNLIFESAQNQLNQVASLMNY